MKRIALLMMAIAVTILLYSSTASLQQGNPKQLQAGDSLAGMEMPVDALPQTYMNAGTQHKLFIGEGDEAVYESLRSQNAIVNEINYGSYRMIVVDENALGGRAQMYALSVPVRDDQNLIALNGYILDTTNPDATYESLPADLKSGEMMQALRKGGTPTSGLYLVQFAGPIQDEWLESLKETGAEIVSYMPSNAYVVRANNYAAASLATLKQQHSFVQFVGDYEPAFRLSSDLRAMRQLPAGTPIKVVVQVIDGAEAESTIATLKALATEFEQSYRVLNYHNCELTIDSSKLADIAKLDNIFGIDERTERKRMDEAQGQILAGNLSGNAPSGPGYLSWLGTKGFTSSQFTSFSVNVVDDAYSLTGHPDLPSTRVAFNNNPTSQTGAQGGHGFLNAHIVAGYNNSTGSAYEDASGYNYGLGIAPWAKVGATAIFGNGSSSSTAWENTAYGQGARISTNSWGYTGSTNRKYNAYAQEYDRIVRDAQSGVSGNQQMIVVFAAGNDGSASNTIGSPGTAKNVITVGAGENYRQTGTDGCAIGNTGADSANDIISFSSRGPVNSSGGDGRVKPDIMGPGTHIEAGVPQSNYDGSSVCNKYWPSGQTLYGWSSGTSHSCPAIAGGAALLYQDFLNKGRPAPSPAMVKAYLQNSATHMTGVGANDTLPSNNQGMGRMNLGRAFDSTARILVDQTQVLGATGATYTVTGSVATTSQPFRVTLAWSDAPGPTTGAPWVNNLDLEVTVNGATYKGNVFSGANSITGGTADSKNNAESVFIPAGVSGNFTVTVKATNIAGDGVPGNSDTTDQDFALVIYNANTGTSTSPTIGVSPSSMTFTATAGGSNPAAQTLNISNTGGGTLSWTASDNATWLTLSSTSGTAPSSTSVSVNISGLAAGTYNGTITITATGATNSPLTVPVTLTVSSSGGGSTELLVNGGFETSVSPWVGSGSGALYTSNGNYPQAGTGYIYFGNANSVSGQYYQQVSIPSTATGTLTFYLNVTSSETTTTSQYDKLFVEVRSTSGTLLSTLATYSNLNKGTAGVYTQKSLNVSAYKGQTVRIQFRTTTDSSLVTTFRVDSASLK